MGTVTLAQNGSGDVKIDIALVSPLKFFHSGIGSTIGFNIAGTPAIGIGYNSNTNFYLAGATASSSQTAAGTYHFSAFGDFEYSLALSTGKGLSNAQPSPEIFDITAPGLKVADFGMSASTGIPSYFAMDITNGTNTGSVGTGTTPPVNVPDGGITLMLLGGVLFGFETLRRRVRA